MSPNDSNVDTTADGNTVSDAKRVSDEDINSNFVSQTDCSIKADSKSEWSTAERRQFLIFSQIILASMDFGYGHSGVNYDSRNDCYLNAPQVAERLKVMSDTATEDNNLIQVQERLMKMLESVRLDSNAEAESLTAPAPAEKPQVKQQTRKVPRCPKCDSTEPWGESSWCPACGYYPKLGKKSGLRSGPAEDNSDLEESEEELNLLQMAMMVPGWIYWLSAGLILLLTESLAVRILVPSLSNRSNIALLQMLIGINVLGISHVRAYLIAAEDDENLNFFSIVWSPTVIWKTTCKRLPHVRRTVYGGTWGAAMLVFAILFIGLDYDNIFRAENFQKNSSFNPLKFVMSAATTMASAQEQMNQTQPGKTSGLGDLLEGVQSTGHGQPTNMEDALTNFAGELESGSQQTNDLQKNERENDHQPHGEQTPEIVKPKYPDTLELELAHEQEFIIFGYLTNAGGDLRSLLLAEPLKDGEKVRYAGKYSLGRVNNEFLTQLQDTLDAHRTRHPSMGTPYIAKWTAPIVRCTIAYNDLTPDGRFEDGRLVSYYVHTADEANKGSGKVVKKATIP